MMPHSQTQADDVDRFLTYPVAYRDRNPVKVVNIATTLRIISKQLRRNAPMLERTRISKTQRISDFNEYHVFHRKLQSIYNKVELKTKTKYRTYKLLSVPNWQQKNSKEIEGNYAYQIIQIMSILKDFNAKYKKPNSKIPKSIKNFLICHFYSSTYELAGKKLVRLANALTNRKNINDAGDALNVLASEHIPYFKRYFNNKLRNGISHENYLIDESITPPVMDYVNIRPKGGRIVISRLMRTDLEQVYKKTICILMFLIASLHVGALRYSAAVDQAIIKADL